MVNAERYAEAVRKATFGRDTRKPIADACEAIRNDGPDDISFIEDGAKSALDEFQPTVTAEIKQIYDDSVEKVDLTFEDDSKEAERLYNLQNGRVTDGAMLVDLMGEEANQDTFDDALAVREIMDYGARGNRDWAFREGEDYKNRSLQKIRVVNIEASSEEIDEYQAAAIREIETFQSEKVQEIEDFHDPVPATIEATYNANKDIPKEEYDEAYPQVDQGDVVVRLEDLLDTRVEEITKDPMETWYTYDYELTPVQIEGEDYRLDSIRAEITVSPLGGEWYQVSDSKAEDGTQFISGSEYAWTAVNPPIAEHIHHGDDYRLIIRRHNEINAQAS